MAKLADLLRGKKARRTIPFPGLIDSDGVEKTEVVFDLVILSGTQEATVLEKARAFAKAKGVDAPKAGEPEYDLGLMVHTLLLACVDHDSPEKGSLAPFFASAAEVLDNLDRETIAWLYAQQQLFQDELSPTPKDVSEEKIWSIILGASQLEEGDDSLRFFESLPPATLERSLRFMAKQLVSLLRARSAISSTPEPSGGSGSASTPPSETLQ